MRRLLVPLAGLALALGATAGASAASPDYCALYAREFALEYARQVKTRPAGESPLFIQDRAFYRCLNLDEEPPMPSASAYVEIEDEAAAAAEPAPKKPTKTAAWRGSGLKAWSPEWKAWCAKHFPNSFNPKTGTVLPYKGKRTLCR